MSVFYYENMFISRITYSCSSSLHNIEFCICDEIALPIPSHSLHLFLCSTLSLLSFPPIPVTKITLFMIKSGNFTNVTNFLNFSYHRIKKKLKAFFSSSSNLCNSLRSKAISSSGFNLWETPHSTRTDINVKLGRSHTYT